MNDFERVLENCLGELESGASTLDDCLLRHPEHAAQLKPILLTAMRLDRGHAVKPSTAFKARARAELTLHMQANPRRKARTGFVFWKLATGFAVLMLALLVTGTVYAQSALPGDVFYPWKLASENVWRALSPDPVAVDIAIANRRIDEMNALADDPARWAEAYEGYLETVNRLRSELDAKTLEEILPRIEFEQNLFEDPGQPIPTQTPDGSLPAGTDIPIPSIPIVPTAIPDIIPTIEVPPTIP